MTIFGRAQNFSGRAAPDPAILWRRHYRQPSDILGGKSEQLAITINLGTKYPFYSSDDSVGRT